MSVPVTDSVVALAASDPAGVAAPSDGLVPYWIETAEVSARGATDPLIVAAVLETAAGDRDRRDHDPACSVTDCR